MRSFQYSFIATSSVTDREIIEQTHGTLIAKNRQDALAQAQPPALARWPEDDGWTVSWLLIPENEVSRVRRPSD